MQRRLGGYPRSRSAGLADAASVTDGTPEVALLDPLLRYGRVASASYLRIQERELEAAVRPRLEAWRSTRSAQPTRR